MSDNDFNSDLHPKHQQALMDAYRTTKKLYSNLERNSYVKAPSNLRSIKRSLESVLTESGVLEHKYICTECGYKMWVGEYIPDATVVDCTKCDAEMQKFSTRSVSDE